MAWKSTARREVLDKRQLVEIGRLLAGRRKDVNEGLIEQGPKRAKYRAI